MLEAARLESVITVSGEVVERSAETVNERLATGQVEVQVSEAVVESEADQLTEDQMLGELHGGFKIGGVSCPAAYFEDASSINFQRSVKYGLGVLWVSAQLFLQRKSIASFAIFDPEGRRLQGSETASATS